MDSPWTLLNAYGHLNMEPHVEVLRWTSVDAHEHIYAVSNPDILWASVGAHKMSMGTTTLDSR